MMANADLIALIGELGDAETDSERAEIAGRIVDLDGRWDAADLNQFELVAKAQQIIQEQIEGRTD
jgi:hypothetical protein